MKISSFVLATVAASVSLTAFAEVKTITGSGTLNDYTQEAIVALDLKSELAYKASSSGDGETALVDQKQYIAPMSRAPKAAAIAAAAAKGITLVAHEIAIDGIGVWVNTTNKTAKLDIPTINKIFTCQITKWEDVPGSAKTGTINAFRRELTSGTTDTFQNLTGVKTFGECVKEMGYPAIGSITKNDANAVVYGGENARIPENRAVPVAKDASSAAVELSVATIKDKSYPMARPLFLVEAKGSEALASEGEKAFLAAHLNNTNFSLFLAPILLSKGFVPVDAVK